MERQIDWQAVRVLALLEAKEASEAPPSIGRKVQGAAAFGINDQ
jgi:hypothetical protein